MQYTPFRYTGREAAITAKWQVGVRNYTLPLAVVPFAAIVLLTLAGLLGWLPGTSSQMTPPLAICMALLLLVVLYVLYRLRTTAAELAKRPLEVSFDGDTVVVRVDETATYVTRFEDITAVDYGADIVRVQSDYGAYCIPRRLVPADFIDKMRRTGAAVMQRRWM